MADTEKHEAFRKWALSQGVELNGVTAHRFPGRGLGIVATEAAKVRLVCSVNFSHDPAVYIIHHFHFRSILHIFPSQGILWLC